MNSLPPETLATIEALKANEPHYRPNDSVKHELGKRTIALLISPMDIGKTTVIKEVCKLDPDFFEVQGITARQWRPNEHLGEFRAFYPHTPASIAYIKQLHDAGKLVQYAVHPQTGYIYATTLEDYGPTYNLATNPKQ